MCSAVRHNIGGYRLGMDMCMGMCVYRRVWTHVRTCARDAHGQVAQIGRMGTDTGNKNVDTSVANAVGLLLVQLDFWHRERACFAIYGYGLV